MRARGPPSNPTTSSASTSQSLHAISGLSPKPRRSITSKANSAASGRCSLKHSSPQVIVPCTSTARGASAPDSFQKVTCTGGLATIQSLVRHQSLLADLANSREQNR
jgi:hypothetical protein